MSEDFETKLLAELAEFNEHHYEGLCRVAQALNNIAVAIETKQALRITIEEENNK